MDTRKITDTKDKSTSVTPPVRSGQCPALWEMDEFTFQEMCCALLEQEEDVRTCKVYGTRGQPQFGIDLLACNQTQGEHSVGQCKCCKTFPPSDIAKASSDFLKYWEGKWSKEGVSRYILMVACDVATTQQRDEELRQRAIFAQKGLAYEIWARNTICNRLRPHRGIISQYIDPEWVDRICGKAIPTEQTVATTPTLVNEILANQFEQSLAIISEDTVAQLDAMREAFRSGGMQEAQDWISSAKRDAKRWKLLRPIDQAKILRFEASLRLEMQQFDDAKTLASQASSLDPNFNDIVLRTLLKFQEEGPESALIEMQDAPVDVDALNLKALLLLETEDLAACELVFNNHDTQLRQHPESLRLRALLLRMQGKLECAARKIGEAIAQKPNWVAVRFATALIDFERALAPGVLDREFCPAFRTVDWSLIRRDDASLQLIRRATATFDELIRTSTHNPKQRCFLEGWKLTCLACDFERQDEADDYCRDLLAANPEHPVAIMWALGRGYACESLSKPIACLESRLQEKTADPKHVVCLVMCFLAQHKVGKAIAVLRKKKGLFKLAGARGAWLNWMVQCLASNGQRGEALQLLKEVPGLSLRNRLKSFVLNSTSSSRGDSEEAIQQLLTCYDETHRAEYLFYACSAMARDGLWKRIFDYVESLITLIGTEESIRLSSIALFNIKAYGRVLEVLDSRVDAFPSGTIPHDLRNIRVRCKIHIGQINEAVADASLLYAQDPSANNLLLYTDALVRKGDLTTLELVARTIISEGDLPASATLFVCHQISDRNPDLARQLFRQVLKHELPTDLMAQALHHAIGLGLETEVAPFLARVPELAAEPANGFKACQIDDFVRMLKVEREQQQAADSDYIRTGLPIHVIAERFGPNLAVFYHTNLKVAESNQKSPKNILLARHGGMPIASDLEDRKPSWRLYVDITALLLAHHLDILTYALDTFAPLRISSRTIPVLKEMKRNLLPQQPTRLEAQKVILHLVNVGKLRVRDVSQPSSKPSALELCRLYPHDWVSLFEQLESEAGFVVDHLPPFGRHMSAQPPDLPDFCRSATTNLRAVADSLLEHGPLSQAQFEAALIAMGTYGSEEGYTTIPSQGCALHLRHCIPETFAIAGILEQVSERFCVTIDRDFFEECNLEVNQRRPLLDETAVWLDSLIEAIAGGLDSNKFEAVPLTSSDQHSEEDVSATSCLLDILADCGPIVSGEFLNAVWCDDRTLQKATINNEHLVLGVYEILKGLLAASTITEEKYFQTLLSMRSAFVLFVPLEVDEVLFHLSQAHVRDGRLTETMALNTLRRYAAVCLDQKNILLQASENPQSRSNRGEIDVVLNLASIPREAMARVWNAVPYDIETCTAKSEWIFLNLYISSIGALNVSGARKGFHNAEQFECLDADSLLVNSHWINQNVGETGRPRRDFLRWVHDRILQKRVRACPILLNEMISYIVRVSGDNEFDWEELAINGKNLDPSEYYDAWRAHQQRFFDDLPEAIRKRFSEHEDFLREISVSAQINVFGRKYNVDDFFHCATEAVCGASVRCPIQCSEEFDNFSPSTKVHKNAVFLIEHAGTTTPVSDEAFWILHSSEARRRELLRQNRRWFDCPQEVFESCVQEISAIESPEKRFRQLSEWRSASFEGTYGELQRLLRDTQRVDFRCLALSRPDCILYHCVGDFPGDTDASLAVRVSQVSKERIASDGFLSAFLVVCGLPIPLPESLLSHFLSLAEEERSKVITSLRKRYLSPVGQMHLVRLALTTESSEHIEFAREQASHFLSKDYSEEISAFLSVLSWVAADMDLWAGVSAWALEERLVLLWTHSGQVMKLLVDAGAPWNWIKEVFVNADTQLTVGLFACSEYRHDVANPQNLCEETFLLPGLAYCLAGTNILSASDREALCDKVFEPADMNRGQNCFRLVLLRDPTQQGNALGSFLGSDRGISLSSLLSASDEAMSLSEELRSNVRIAVDKLGEIPEDALSWLQLAATLGNSPAYEELVPELEDIIDRLDFHKLGDQSFSDIAVVLIGVAYIIASTEDHERFRRIKSGVFELLRCLCQRTGQGGSPEDINIIPGCLEVLFSLATLEKDLIGRAKALAESFAELQSEFNDIIPDLDIMLRRITEDLPPTLAEHFWSARLLARLQTRRA